MGDLKLYIAVLDAVPAFMVPTLVAHSVLGAHFAFTNEDGTGETNHEYYQWLTKSFKKVVVKVNQKEFDKIAAMHRVYLGHENTTLDGKKSCAVICPRTEYPNVIKFAKLYTP